MTANEHRWAPRRNSCTGTSTNFTRMCTMTKPRCPSPGWWSPTRASWSGTRRHAGHRTGESEHHAAECAACPQARRLSRGLQKHDGDTFQKRAVCREALHRVQPRGPEGGYLRRERQAGDRVRGQTSAKPEMLQETPSRPTPSPVAAESQGQDACKCVQQRAERKNTRGRAAEGVCVCVSVRACRPESAGRMAVPSGHLGHHAPCRACQLPSDRSPEPAPFSAPPPPWGWSPG